MELADYKCLPAQGISAWVCQMAEIAEKAEDSSGLPKLELLLRSGNLLRGHILKVEKHEEETIVVVVNLEDNYNNSSNITFFPEKEVIAFTLLESEVYLKHHVMPALSQSVGNLELKRAVREIQDKIQAITASRVNLQADTTAVPEDARWEVLQVLETLPEIMEKLLADELGKEMLLKKVENITVSTADKARTRLEDKTLKIEIKTPFKGPISAEKDRILSEVETLL